MNALTPRDLIEKLNLSKQGRRYRGVCPACDYDGTLVMTIKNGDGVLWCASCRDESAIWEKVRDMAGDRPVVCPDQPTKPKDDAARIAKALRCWEGATPAANSPARLYLAARGLPHLADSSALRWRPDNTHPERGREAVYDAMIALVSDGYGKPVAVHRTYINRQGRKSGLTPSKATLGPLHDGAIRLADPGRELVIGEGIETAASLGLIMGLPAWAAVSAGHMPRVALPLIVRHVIIAMDPDPAGRRWAHEAGRRWEEQGREVTLAIPDKADQDFNDILMERLARGETFDA